jgi:hypothetical protein
MSTTGWRARANGNDRLAHTNNRVPLSEHGTQSETLRIGMTEIDLSALRVAAMAAGKPLATWCRWVLLNAAKEMP